MGAQEFTLEAIGASANSEQDSEFFLAFDYKSGHNFIGRSGNFYH